MKGSQEADPDYSKVMAPALSFFTIYDAPFIPLDADAALREQIGARWNAYGKPFHRQQIERFRRDVRNGQVIELHDMDHADFMANTPKMAPVIAEMRRFLLNQ